MRARNFTYKVGALLLGWMFSFSFFLHATYYMPIGNPILTTKLLEFPIFSFPIDTVPQSYTILAGGHWYGAHGNAHSIYPATSIWAHLLEIKAANPNLVVALGDVLRSGADTLQIQGFRKLEKAIGAETKVTLGNHDFDLETVLQNKFGEFFESFSRDRNLFLFLNTQWIANGGAKFTADYIATLRSDTAYEKVFVFSHHLFWALTEPGFAQMDEFANAAYSKEIETDSANYLYASILEIAKEGELFWFSGDVGTEWSFPIFADHSADQKRHFYASGIGDRPEDAFLKIVIPDSGEVEVEIFPLGPQAWDSLDHYNLKFWESEIAQRRRGEDLSWMDKFERTIYAKKFWAGMLSGIVFMLFVMLLGRILKQKRKN